MEVYFESYGCTANHNSTEIMKGLVKQAGLNLTSNPDYSDFIIFNSCIVKEPTQEKIRKRVFDFLKKGKKVILAGCMPRLSEKSLKKTNLFLLDSTHVRDIVNLLKDIQSNNYSFGDNKYLALRNEMKLSLPKIPDSNTIGVTQISEGCLGECSYCIVKLAKGKLFSYPIEEIIKSVKSDIANGCKEIWITSQDNASYGIEKGSYLLPELLKQILDLKGNFYVRLGMLNPNNVLPILDELIEIYKHKKMFKFLHMPIQSGSDKILNMMKRKYNIKDVLKIISKFKEQIPDITISSDIIVGFPGETQKDFEETLEVVEKIQPEILNRSNFGLRRGTEAEKLRKVFVSPELINQRAKVLQELHLNICKQMQTKFIGKTFKVLIDKKGFGNTYLGRMENYKLVAVQSKDKSILGKIANVKIKSAMPHYLLGEVEEGDC